MCTRVVWPDANGAVIVGRNMDFRMDTLTNLWKYPRGIERDNAVDGELKWTSKYGSVVATAFDLVGCDGMNEEGFAGHVLWLAESEYAEPGTAEVQLNQALWLQYYLDNFATVEEAVEWTLESDVAVIQLIDPTGYLVPALHLAINDATGDSAIIEYIDRELKVYHSRDYQVMTNSPTYDKQLELVEQYEGLGGDEPLPGSTAPDHRFARAAYYVANQQKPKTQFEAMAAMFSIVRNVAQPFRNPAPGSPDVSQTIWQVVLDATNKRYAFESTLRPNIVWVDLNELDFSEGAEVGKVDLVGELALQGGLAGDVSDRFAPVSALTQVKLDAGMKLLELVARQQEEYKAVEAKVLQGMKLIK